MTGGGGGPKFCPVGCGVVKPTRYAIHDHMLNVHPENFFDWKNKVLPSQTAGGPSGGTESAQSHSVPGRPREGQEDPVPGRDGTIRPERYAEALFSAAHPERFWSALVVGSEERSYWLNLGLTASRLTDVEIFEWTAAKRELLGLYKKRLAAVHLELEQEKRKQAKRNG